MLECLDELQTAAGLDKGSADMQPIHSTLVTRLIYQATVWAVVRLRGTDLLQDKTLNQHTTNRVTNTIWYSHMLNMSQSI